MKNKLVRNYVDGYMTVEAGFIIPFVFIIFMIMVYFVFYLFNNSVLYQKTYIAALRGQQLRTASVGETRDYIEKQLDELLNEQIFQYQLDYGVTVNTSSIKVSSNSKIENRLARFGLYSRESMDSKSKISMNQIDMIKLVWLLHKF